MAKGMYFGNRNFMQWIMPPQINYEAGRKTRISTQQFLNGGTAVRRTATGSRNYNFSWTLKPRDQVRAVLDYYDGVYGTDDPIYFLDPFAMDKNLMPAWWAAPALGAKDAPLLAYSSLAARPSLIATPANGLGYPTFAAQYTMSSGMTKPPLYIPIPPDHRLWVGVHGATSGNGAVNLIPATGPATFGSATALPFLSATTTTRVSNSVDGDNYPGAFLQMAGSSGTVTLYGVIAQVLPWNVTPSTGGFISGQGHSGCQFSEDPVYTQNSAALDKVSLSVSLTEVGGWL